MKVIVTGATGYLGKALVPALLRRGDQVVVLSRNAEKGREALGAGVEVLEWHPPQPGGWMEAFNGADGVVNLAGESLVAVRWTEAKKQRIRASRVDATRAVVEAIERADPRPSVLINASAVGYYGDRGDAVLTEESEPGQDFIAGVVKDWEAAARPVETLGVRLVLLRTGIVLGPGGGALLQLIMPFRFFLGGTMGRPGQWVPWIHLEDEIALILYALDHELRGPVNAVSPHPVTMETLSRQIGQAMGRPSWLPGIGLGLQLALGELGQSLLVSERVVPDAAQRSGYQFQYTDSGEALRSILG